MWLFLLCMSTIIWTIWWRIKNRELIKLYEQIKIDAISWPVIGHALLALSFPNRMKLFTWIGTQSLNIGGLIGGWLGPHLIIVSTNPEDIDVIAKRCLEKPEIMDFIKELFGNGSIFAPVSIWRPRRKMLAPIFSTKNLNMFVEVFDKNSYCMVDRLKEIEESGPFPFWNYITSYSMSSVCETTLGHQIDTKSEQNSNFLSSFEICTELGSERLLRPWLNIDFIYRRLNRYKIFLVCRKILYEFIDKVIHLKKKDLQGNNEKLKPHVKSVLEMMMEAGNKQGFTDKDFREETLALVLAGTDTSAVAVSLTCILLSQHPEVQDKIYEEIQNMCGNSNTITSADLPKLKYLEAVIKESLRLYPPIPAVLRKVTERVELPSGPTLVPGCTVILHFWGTHRNPRHWGEDADQFRPERFLEATPRHPAAFIAFSHAHRNCLGYQYAMMSMKTAVATLVRNYRLLPVTSPDSCGHYPPLNIEYNIILREADKFQLKLKSRNAS